MALTPRENNALTDDAAEVYFSTEDRYNYLIQLRSDILALDSKSYTGNVSINELKADGDLGDELYDNTVAELAAIAEQRGAVYDTLYQFFRTDNTSATGIINASGDRILTLDGSDNVVIANYP